MKCLQIWNNINGSIEAIGVLLAGLAAVISLPKIANNSLRKLKDETYFDNEAYLKFKEIESTLPTASPFVWGPIKWEGGANFKSMLEIKQHIYSPKTDGVEWKDIKKSIRYVYEEQGQLMVKGWRIK
jgi:hypothetical protein